MENYIVGFHEQGTLECLDPFITMDMIIEKYCYDGFENEAKLAKKIGDRKNLCALFEQDIEACAKRIGFDLGKKVWYDQNRNKVGLAVDNDGTGTIDLDGEYDTYYWVRLKDLYSTNARCLVKHLQSKWNRFPNTEEIIKYLSERSLELELGDLLDVE